MTSPLLRHDTSRHRLITASRLLMAHSPPKLTRSEAGKVPGVPPVTFHTSQLQLMEYLRMCCAGKHLQNIKPRPGFSWALSSQYTAGSQRQCPDLLLFFFLLFLPRSVGE